jgi:hypothetical protein
MLLPKSLYIKYMYIKIVNSRGKFEIESEAKGKLERKLITPSS